MSNEHERVLHESESQSPRPELRSTTRTKRWESSMRVLISIRRGASTWTFYPRVSKMHIKVRGEFGKPLSQTDASLCWMLRRWWGTAKTAYFTWMAIPPPILSSTGSFLNSLQVLNLLSLLCPHVFVKASTSSEESRGLVVIAFCFIKSRNLCRRQWPRYFWNSTTFFGIELTFRLSIVSSSGWGHASSA